MNPVYIVVYVTFVSALAVLFVLTSAESDRLRQLQTTRVEIVTSTPPASK